MTINGKSAQGQRELVFDYRFEGPPNITQGGYLSGMMAVCLGSKTVEVTMRHPTPMGKPLVMDTNMPNRVLILDGDKLLNEGRPAELEIEIPDPITLEDARRASLRHVTEPRTNCFGCGSARSEDDGLHLRSGPVEGRDLVAIDWTPQAAAVGADNGQEVPEPVVWAAMECSTARAMELGGLRREDELFLLGRMTTNVLALPQVGQPCFMMGWPVGRDGRKIKLAGTLHDQDGRVLVISQLLFITLKQGVTYESFAPSGA
jgi:hypothetical protein